MSAISRGYQFILIWCGNSTLSWWSWMNRIQCVSAEVWHNIAGFSFICMAALPVAVQAVRAKLNWTGWSRSLGQGEVMASVFLLSCFALVVFKYPHLFIIRGTCTWMILPFYTLLLSILLLEMTNQQIAQSVGKCHVGRIAIPLNHGSAFYHLCNPSVQLTQIDSYSFLFC